MAFPVQIQFIQIIGIKVICSWYLFLHQLGHMQRVFLAYNLHNYDLNYNINAFTFKFYLLGKIVHTLYVRASGFSKFVYIVPRYML